MHARAVATLSLEALIHNLRALSRHAGGVPVLLPFKADAYGHGALALARALEAMPELDVLWGYGVASADEAFELLELPLRRPLLVLTPTDPADAAELARRGARVTVSTLEEGRALPPGSSVHLKVNTGMNRLGVAPQQALQLLADLEALGLRVEGVFSHFASADADDLTHARTQLEAFEALCAQLPPGVLRHLSSSSGVAAFGPRGAFDLIRPGISSYGYPACERDRGLIPLRPVMTLRARIGLVREVQPGDPVSYGGLWRAETPATLAVVSLGYADGYPRNATGQAQAVVQGVRRPVRGRICMDQMMLDVTGLTVQPGDWVELISPGGPDADEVASWGGTISYELLVRLGRRIERRVVPMSVPLEARHG
ncbi:alanine racemase [Deinobacterium chartae]|uniref:Alanine racemase n=1 Tax=Deinobacterium chartae TaxID=521158 RepID=A0A841HZ67_9DEIO|nr:alanine racemase [Deinobacterium chartae]MBB6097964.1 alanine racemase [Deinobacterium chartae]